MSDKNTIKKRQRFLKARRFDPGPIDGVEGPWTQKAEAAYQASLADLKNVIALQKFLNEQGASPKLHLDGIYGEKTKAAELEYQKRLEDPADPAETEPPKIVRPSDDRGKIMQIARSLVGVRELTGRNDGVQIDLFLASCGLSGTRNPYCACFNVYCGDAALGRTNNPYPRSAWSPDMVVKPTWQQGIGGKNPLPADTFGIYFASKGRVAHTGLILEWKVGERHCLTIEGNTGDQDSIGTSADREGQGVFMKRRMKSDIFAVRNWID
jgi:peptidoglycan hydrolase-like protein with peptidoglycan-binding domain